ncbi:MAG TPA: glycosyltransferase family 4 protein [Methanotrichaceae archaeon]|nr:glycosyltransferase family 4 protein [Methanotrichaceae archaeon]
MRIGMLSWESLYSVKVGGVAPHVSEISEALARRGHEVHIFTRRGEFDSFDRINGVYYQRVDFEESGGILNQMDNMSRAMADRFGRVSKIFGQFDLAHGHDWHVVGALDQIKHQYQVPYIWTIHSTEWGRNGNSPSQWEGSAEISHREWLGGYESALIIVTTERMREEIRQIYSIPDSKIRTIPNGIIAGKIRRALDPGRIKERFGISPIEPVVLFCGRMNYQKGPDLLVEAIPRILRERGDVRFIFVGEGDMRESCQRLAHDLGVEFACRFPGYLPGATKEELMNACDMVCVPSRNEPFGVVVLEGWDVGKPVVATEAISIIRNFRDGILAYVQPESLAWCINHLLQHPDEMRRMSEEGQRRVETEYSWDNIARLTEGVYQEVMAAGGKRPD